MNRNLFYRLLEPVHPKAEVFCRKLAGNREDGDDIYQESLLKALLKFESLKDEQSFRPWLYRIVVNTYKNRTRRSWWRRHVTLTPELADAQIGPDPSQQQAARRQLDRALKALKPEDRALVVLFELEGWSIDELAGLMRKPHGTIKARLSRARKRMRQKIAQDLIAGTEKTLTGDRICVAVKPNNE